MNVAAHTVGCRITPWLAPVYLCGGGDGDGGGDGGGGGDDVTGGAAAA